MPPGPAEFPDAVPAPVLTAMPRVHRGWRVFVFYSSAVLLAGLVSTYFADLLWRTGWSAAHVVLLVCFVVLFLLASVGCMNALYGFVVRILGDQRRITGVAEYRSRSIEGTSTALVFPVHNEEVSPAYEGLRATYQSLERTGQLEKFDIFILSDSTDADKW